MFWDFKNHSRYIKSWKACLKSLKCYDDRGWNKMRFRNPRDLTSPASQSRDLPKWRQCVPAVLENIVRGVWIKRMVASLVKTERRATTRHKTTSARWEQRKQDFDVVPKVDKTPDLVIFCSTTMTFSIIAFTSQIQTQLYRSSHRGKPTCCRTSSFEDQSQV